MSMLDLVSMLANPSRLSMLAATAKDCLREVDKLVTMIEQNQAHGLMDARIEKQAGIVRAWLLRVPKEMRE